MSGFRITIVSAESMTDGYAPFAHTQGLKSAFEKMGHSVQIIGMDHKAYHEAGILTRLWRYLVVNWRAVLQLRDSDVMIARAHFANLCWVMAAWLFRKPVIHEMNGMVFDASTTHKWLKAFQWVITASYRLQLRTATGVACVTDEIAQHVRKFAPNAHVDIVKNGVDPDIFFPGDHSKRKPYAVFPSALTAWHGVNTLLDAIEDPDWPQGLELVVAGDGAQTPLVTARASRNKKIHYLGLLPRTELARVLREAEIGLCLVESLSGRGVKQVFPLKLFEMLASGLPIVTTDLPGQREIVLEARAGIVVSRNDASALAQAIATIHGDPDRKDMGRRAHIVSSKHSWQVRAIELERFILSSLERTAAYHPVDKS